LMEVMEGEEGGGPVIPPGLCKDKDREIRQVGDGSSSLGMLSQARPCYDMSRHGMIIIDSMPTGKYVADMWKSVAGPCHDLAWRCLARLRLW